MNTKKQNDLKKIAAKAALQYAESHSIIGIGTGSTINYFIEYLAAIKHKIDAAIPSSDQTEILLKKYGIPVADLNSINTLPIYIDGADEFNTHRYLTKGGGGALTREKILATSADQFVCIVDVSKQVSVLGSSFAIPIEVIPMARGYVARQLVKLGASPEYREGFTTDNGNIILDCYNFKIVNPIETERMLNNITGVVCNGVFAQRQADIILMAHKNNTVDILQ